MEHSSSDELFYVVAKTFPDEGDEAYAFDQLNSLWHGTESCNQESQENAKHDKQKLWRNPVIKRIKIINCLQYGTIF